MKYPIKTVMLAALAFASCQMARADITSVSTDTNVTSWDGVAFGGSTNTPFYTTSLSSLSSQGFPGAGTGPYEVLSETFTITNNGAGGLSATAASSNYVLNAISIMASGGPGQVQVH